ncbi:MAG: hypothetical protein ABH851_04945, partial [Methanobacteriota archaeon]
HLETSNTLMEAGRKSGYSGIAGNLYRKNIKKHIAEIIHSDPEAIKARFNDIMDRAREKEDFTAELRGLEALARINAMFTDKSEVKSTPVNEIIITHITTKPSDNTSPTNRLPKEAEKHE